MKKKAFTLIELIAVLVVLAILALFVTPLVMSIIKKARISADKRSIDAYGRSVELAIANYLLDNGKFPTSIEQLIIEYTGKEVICNVMQIKENGEIYLSECTVGGKQVKDETEDGYYHYGRLFKNYDVGDSITYNNVNYYVIKYNESSITLLKEIPLTADEINQYGGVGTANNHVNMYVNPKESYYQTAGITSNGYGGVAFYTSENCGISSVVSAGNVSYNRITTDCKRDYESSEVKYIVDAWVNDIANGNDLIADSTGYKARLPERSDFGMIPSVTSQVYVAPKWVYDDYSYWLANINGSNGGPNSVAILSYGGYAYFNSGDVYGLSVVRPVITIKKSALEN